MSEYFEPSHREKFDAIHLKVGERRVWSGGEDLQNGVWIYKDGSTYGNCVDGPGRTPPKGSREEQNNILGYYECDFANIRTEYLELRKRLKGLEKSESGYVPEDELDQLDLLRVEMDKAEQALREYMVANGIRTEQEKARDAAAARAARENHPDRVATRERLQRHYQ